MSLLTLIDTRPYLTWLDFILEMQDPPLTISTSYGDNEQTGWKSIIAILPKANNHTVPLAFAQRACSQFAQLGGKHAGFKIHN